MLLSPPAFRPPTKTSKKTIATPLRAVARRVQTVTRRLLCLDRPRLVADAPVPETNAVDSHGAALYLSKSLASNAAIHSLVFGDSVESVDLQQEVSKAAEIQPDQVATPTKEQLECQKVSELIWTASSCSTLVVWSPPLSAVYGPKEQGVIERLVIPQEIILLVRRPYMALIPYSATRFPWEREVIGGIDSFKSPVALFATAEPVIVYGEGEVPEALPTEAVAEAPNSNAQVPLIDDSAVAIESEDMPAAYEATQGGPESPVIEPRIAAIEVAGSAGQENGERVELERRRRIALWFLLFA